MQISIYLYDSLPVFFFFLLLLHFRLWRLICKLHIVGDIEFWSGWILRSVVRSMAMRSCVAVARPINRVINRPKLFLHKSIKKKWRWRRRFQFDQLPRWFQCAINQPWTPYLWWSYNCNHYQVTWNDENDSKVISFQILHCYVFVFNQAVDIAIKLRLLCTMEIFFRE